MHGGDEKQSQKNCSYSLNVIYVIDNVPFENVSHFTA